MKQISNKTNSRIISGSMGSFLLPPLHPGYKFEVETDLNRRKENRGGMSLEYAIECEFTEPQTKKKAIELVKKWEETEKLPISSKEVQNWIRSVTNHMNVGDKAIKYIQKYYPEYKGLSL